MRSTNENVLLYCWLTALTVFALYSFFFPEIRVNLQINTPENTSVQVQCSKPYTQE
jgi:hypothetical protein